MKLTALFISLVFLATTASSQQLYKIKECVIEKGVLKIVEVDYNPANGERTITVNGVTKKFYNVYPQDGKEYASKAGWYINNEEVPYKTAKFIKYGLPRVLGSTEVVRTGEYGGVGIYTEAGVPENEVAVIYVPVRSGCEFQPYQRKPEPCAKVTLKASKAQAKEGDILSFTATVIEPSATPAYKWYLSGGEIVGSDNTRTIKVSTKGFTGKLEVEVAVSISGKLCEPANEYVVVDVKKK